MAPSTRPALCSFVLLGLSATCLAGGLDSLGNTDGVLTWHIGTLEPNASARQVVLFVHDDSPAALAKRLEGARKHFAEPTPPSPDVSSRSSSNSPVWITNDSTDFALEGPAMFRWRSRRQALQGAKGGQLSQFTWYVHYQDEAGKHRAGTPHTGPSVPENLEVIQPVRALGRSEAVAVLQTADEKLGIRVRAVVGPGKVVGVEFVLTNRHAGPIRNLRLSAYANIEAAHTHEGDFSMLDRRVAGLLVVDPDTGMCVAMAGLDPPVSGYSGTWSSLDKLQTASGVPFDQWRTFNGMPPALKTTLARLRARADVPDNIYLPAIVINPTTPETRTLTTQESRAALERDWLFQAMDIPVHERTLAEIGWARQLAERLAGSGNAPDLKAELAELDRLEAQLRQMPAVRSDYLAVRTIKRRISMKNPLLDFTKLLLIDQPYPQGREAKHEAIHRLGYTAVPGGRLLVVDGLHPGAAVRRLFPDRPGAFWRPDLSFDAERILFCYKAHDEKSFHLYEIDADGTNLRQLTDGDYDDLDPIYLPDGHIIFTTTRGNSYVRCGPFIYSTILARCDADGGNIYLISHGAEPDFVPSLMEDGRVIYSRWEYTDKPLWRVQSLWTTHQDGTGTAVFWGNQSVWPDHLSEPRQIPGSRRVMFTGVGHHDWWPGSIGIIDPGEGLNFPDGLTKVTTDLRWPECSKPPIDRPESPRYHVSGHCTGYKTPYPLSEQDFLVSARGEGAKFRLYWMDTDGNRELIYEGMYNVLHAIPVKPRAVPLQHPDRVVWPGTGKDRTDPIAGVFFNPDVYEGVPDLPRGIVKYLRVFQMDHKTYSTWHKTWRHSGPAVSVVQEEGVKRILSVVPVEEDGSVHFEVPSGRALHFQLLDEHYRCLHTMRSFTGVMPGERRGCTGCHEKHSTAPPPKAGLALLRPPTPLSPPPWGTASIGFERFVQPVLNRHCGKCHQGDAEGRKTLDLTLRPGHDVFKEPYLTLVGSAGWSNPVPDRKQPGYGIAGAIAVESMDPSLNDPRAYATLRPMKYLSYTSPLIELATSGKHYDVRVEGTDLRRLIAWIDACCPFMGDREIRALGDPDFPGIEELPIRPRVATAPRIQRP